MRAKGGSAQWRDIKSAGENQSRAVTMNRALKMSPYHPYPVSVISSSATGLNLCVSQVVGNTAVTTPEPALLVTLVAPVNVKKFAGTPVNV